MKERFRPIELTTNPSSPRLERGVNFMPEPGTGEINQDPQRGHRERAQSPREIPQERINMAREGWRQHYLQKGIDTADPHNTLPADERITVEMLIGRGLSPQTATSKDKTITAEEVVANALLTDKERLVKAEKILGPLSEEQKQAILKAHYKGQGGVYNYSGSELREKAEILGEAGFSAEQRRSLIEAGIAAEPIPAAGITHPRLIPIVDQLNREAAHLGERDFDHEVLEGQIKRIEGLIDQGGVFATPADLHQAQDLIQTLKEKRLDALGAYAEKRMKQHPDGLWQALHDEDFELLSSTDRKDHIRFVNKWFDSIYAGMGTKDPSQSAAFEAAQRADQEASVFLSIGRRGMTEKQRKDNSKTLAFISDLFDTRIKNLIMNWGAISSKSIESIQKGSFGLKAHGLLAGETLDDGYTGAMAHRIVELLEDERLKLERGHLTPDLANRIQEMVIEESKALSKQGIGVHVDKDENDIERAVRSAYDLVVNSQRIHIIAARGKELFGPDAFFSDAGAAFKAFNPKTFSSEKWGQFTPTDQRFLREVVEKSLIDEWLEEKRKTYKDYELDEKQKRDLGDILFKTMDSPPDFFSSGWRIKGMKTSLQKYFEHRVFLEEAKVRYEAGRLPENLSIDPMKFTTADWDEFRRLLKQENNGELSKNLIDKAKAQAEKFGLFIRLKTASDKDGGRERAEELQKIQEYRPEEIIRLLREKLSYEEVDEVNKAIFGTSDKVKSYDSFKKEFGAVLRAIREKGFRGEYNNGDPEQIDFTAMTDSVWSDLVNAVGETKAQRVKQIYEAMQGYIKGNNIAYKDTGHTDKKGKRILTTKDTLFDKDCRFADLYDKTLVTDDLMLGNLEVIDDSQRAFGMLELAKKMSNDSGGDAYVRNMNDLAAGHAYADELLAFVRESNEEEKFKHAEAAALKAGDYNGRGGQAKALRHTIVSYMWAAMPPGFFDTLGVEKLPFRRKMTKLEDIYGYHVKNLTQDERREKLDHLEAKLQASIQNELDELAYNLEKNTRKLETGDYEDEEEKEKLEKEIAEYSEKVHKAHEKGEKFKKAAEKYLKVTGGDLMKQKAIGILIFILIGAFGEALKTADIGGKK